MPLSPPVTMRTSFFAVSTMATALSTAECTRSNSPAASPSRCRVEFSVKESCRARPCLAKMPLAMPACRGSGLDYESINVHGNPAGMEELRKLGARSVPVVARGDKFVFAQALGDVIKFLDLKVQMQERLSPDELVRKLELVLPAACRYVRQIPAEWLDKPLSHRNRPIRVLCHHVFRIVEGFLESMHDGRELTYERIMQWAPALRTGEDIARFGESVLARLQAWWQTYPDRSCSRMMDTYFGMHPLHVVLERTAWHPAQHTRQLMLILETLNIKPDRALTAADFAGLPLPDKAWDDEKEAA